MTKPGFPKSKSKDQTRAFSGYQTTYIYNFYNLNLDPWRMYPILCLLFKGQCNSILVSPMVPIVMEMTLNPIWGIFCWTVMKKSTKYLLLPVGDLHCTQLKWSCRMATAINQELCKLQNCATKYIIYNVSVSRSYTHGEWIASHLVLDITYSATCH